jgi:dTMP kinase
LPDRTVLLELDPAVVAARLIERDRGISDRIGGRDAAYHTRVASAFRGFAATDPGRFVVVDAGGAPDAVHARVLAAIVA